MLIEILDKENVRFAEVCYVGDGESDTEAIEAVGLGCCPPYAPKKVCEKAKMVLKGKSGEGMVSAVAETLQGIST